eukprot:403362331
MVLGEGYQPDQRRNYYSSDENNSEFLQLSSPRYKDNASQNQQMGKYQQNHALMIEDFSTEQEAQQLEKEHLKSQSQSLIRFKLAKHEQKIEETLLENCSDEALKQINITQLQRVFRDLAYLCGFVIVTYDDALANDFIQDTDHKTLKNSSVKSIDEFIKYTWTQHHGNQLKRKNYRNSILKLSNKEWPDLGAIGNSNSDLEEIENRVVFFEDQLFERERPTLKIQAKEFRKLLQSFIDAEDNQSVVIDITNEFQQLEAYNPDGRNVDYIFSNMPLVVSNQKDSENFDYIKENLERTLNQYQRLYEIADFRTEKERQFMSELIQQLQIKLDSYQVGKAKKNDQNQIAIYQGVQSFKQIEPKSKYERALQEIFYFYCRQHRVFCITFQEMWDDSINMRVGEFLMFCREFGIKLNRERAVNIFNKIAEFRKPIDFKRFVQLLDYLATQLNEIRIDQLEKRVKMINKLLKQNSKKTQHIKSKQSKVEEDFNKTQPKKSNLQKRKESSSSQEEEEKKVGDDPVESIQQKLVRFDQENQEMDIEQIDATMQSTKMKKLSESKNETLGNDSNKDIEEMQLRIAKIEQQSILLQNEKDKLQSEIERSKAKKADDCNQELMKLLELDNPLQFRAKMKGYTFNPFQMKDLSYRVQKLPDDVLQKRMKIKIKQNSTAEELKKKVEAMKQDRLKRQSDRENSQQQEFRNKEQRKKDLFGKLFSDAETTSRVSRVSTTKNNEQKTGIGAILQNSQAEAIPEEEQIKRKPQHPIFITLNDLDKMNVKQFNRNIRADFQPEDFLFDSDDEENKDMKKKKKPKNQQHNDLAQQIKQKKQIQQNSLENSIDFNPPPKRAEQKRGGHQIANQSEMVAGLKTHRVLGGNGPIKAQQLDLNPNQVNQSLKLKNVPLTSRNHHGKSLNNSIDQGNGYQSQVDNPKSKKLLASLNPKKLVQQSLDLSQKPLQGSLKPSKSLGQLQKLTHAQDQHHQQQQLALALIPKANNFKNKDSIQPEKMLARANEIEKTTQKRNIQSMKDILKMHDKTINKGLKIVKKQ